MEYARLNISQDYVDADLPGGVQRLDQTPASYAQLLTALPAEATCVLEATGPYGLRLLAALRQAQRPVCVVNPLQARRFAQSQLRRSKTDWTDARLLSQFGRAFTPPLHQPTAQWLTHLQQRQALLDLLTRQRTASRNHQHALAHSPCPDPVSTQALEAELARLDQQVADLKKASGKMPRPRAAPTTPGCKLSLASARALPWPCCWPVPACGHSRAGGRPWPMRACVHAHTNRAAACAAGPG